MKPSAYEIVNVIDDTIYVGVSNDPDERWKQHQRHSKRTLINENDYFHNAMRKHGVTAFTFTIIKTFENMDEAFEYEPIHIAELKSLGIKVYNISKGGNGCRGVDEQGRLSRSKRLMGVPKSDELKKKISETLKGRCLTEEHRSNISVGLSNEECKKRRSDAMVGKLHTDETRDKISASSKQMWEDEEFHAKMKETRVGSNNSRAVLNEDSIREIRSDWKICAPVGRGPKGEFYKRYASLLGVNPVTICHIIIGRSWKHVTLKCL